MAKKSRRIFRKFSLQIECRIFVRSFNSPFQKYQNNIAKNIRLATVIYARMNIYRAGLCLYDRHEYICNIFIFILVTISFYYFFVCALFVFIFLPFPSSSFRFSRFFGWFFFFFFFFIYSYLKRLTGIGSFQIASRFHPIAYGFLYLSSQFNPYLRTQLRHIPDSNTHISVRRAVAV